LNKKDATFITMLMVITQSKSFLVTNDTNILVNLCLLTIDSYTFTAQPNIISRKYSSD